MFFKYLFSIVSHLQGELVKTLLADLNLVLLNLDKKDYLIIITFNIN